MPNSPGWNNGGVWLSLGETIIAYSHSDCLICMRTNKIIIFLATVLCMSNAAQAGNITFADSNVKALCVQKWDTNHDGELSEAEAAAVTSLGTVFRGNQTIVTFEELVYFTGLTAINDYAFYQSGIQNVAFPPSVTEIGEYAFSQSSISGELSIPGTVKCINDYAFYFCMQLTDVVLEEGVETVGWHSFWGPIRTLSLPSTLTYMSSMAIDPYINADPSAGVFVPKGDLYVYSHSSTPATIDDYAFLYVFAEAHLIVPFGAVDAYKASDAWSVFREYLEFGDVNLDGIVNDSDLSAIENFMSSGESEFNPLLSDVNFDGVTDAKDVEYLKNYIESSTGVNSISLAPVDTRIYTIDGRCLPDKTDVSSLPHGIYISNGRKFIVK